MKTALLRRVWKSRSAGSATGERNFLLMPLVVLQVAAWLVPFPSATRFPAEPLLRPGLLLRFAGSQISEFAFALFGPLALIAPVALLWSFRQPRSTEAPARVVALCLASQTLLSLLGERVGRPTSGRLIGREAIALLEDLAQSPPLAAALATLLAVAGIVWALHLQWAVRSAAKIVAGWMAAVSAWMVRGTSRLVGFCRRWASHDSAVPKQAPNWGSQAPRYADERDAEEDDESNDSEEWEVRHPPKAGPGNCEYSHNP